MGGMKLALNGESLDLSRLYIYRGMMLSGMPNFAFSVGYTNASWTLKCELTARDMSAASSTTCSAGATPSPCLK